MPVYVSDLADQVLDKSRASEFLYCPGCGAEYSASAGDYWHLDKDQKLRCGNHRPLVDLQLVTKHSVIERVK
jgi:hypothetical protein